MMRVLVGGGFVVIGAVTWALGVAYYQWSHASVVIAASLVSACIGLIVLTVEVE